MSYYQAENEVGTVELDFVKGHIAATMTLIHAMIEQDVLDRYQLDTFFAGFVSQLPHTRETMSLRLIIDQWRNALREGEDEKELRGRLFEVINGGRAS
ncbi:hypothetical protein [Roseibium sediminis]|uniref:hypothetical protein n=1 Tax=Roseibium sediminis TaxID=1775174 RepID=UPI001AD8DCB8|nr:hypothetical protein [Roseibium sediminis]